jgi:nitroreductase
MIKVPVISAGTFLFYLFYGHLLINQETMSSKIATTHNPVIDLIKDRWSARSFSDKEITQKELDTILEAGSWAFSSNNAQPWHFVYAFKKDASFQKLVNCLMPGNQPWAKNAAVLMVVLADKKNPNGSENRIARHDVGAANATLMLQALTMGIYGHVMGGFDPGKTIETLGIDPEVKEPVVFLALGHLDSAEKLEEPFKTRELSQRTRKGLNEISKHFV